MAVDGEKQAYLGEGQLLEEPDTTAGRVTFKLSQCYPGAPLSPGELPGP